MSERSRNGIIVIGGVYFMVRGLLAALSGAHWAEAAWSLALGGGLLIYLYVHNRSALERGRIIWTVAIPWLLVMIALTVVRFNAG